MHGQKIIEIDLGTTNSVVAVMEGGDVTVIQNAEGNRLTPSVVAFVNSGDTLVGEPAKRQAVTNPERTVNSIKRFMGRRRDEVESEVTMVPYQVAGGPGGYVRVKINDKQYTPQEISSKVLRKLKEAAESHLGHKVTGSSRRGRGAVRHGRQGRTLGHASRWGRLGNGSPTTAARHQSETVAVFQTWALGKWLVRQKPP